MLGPGTLSVAMSDPVHTAVILAAGMGTRLEQIGTMIPKGFLQFSERPIVEESILKLRSFGIDRIVIVTGHLHFFYEGLRARYPNLITTVHNPLYEQSGSMYSLWCAREILDDDFLLLESDIIYEDRVLAALLDSPEDSVVLLSDSTNSSDPVHVETESGLLVAMSKDRAKLTGEERSEVLARKAVWHMGNEGKASPAVWKSVIKGRTWYVTNTHRAFIVASTIKGAINRYHKFIKSTT